MEQHFEIKAAISGVLEKMGISDTGNYRVEMTRFEHGTYQCNAAMVLAKRLSRDTQEFAEEIAGFVLSLKSVSKVEVNKAGFINIRLSDDAFIETMQEICEKKNDYCRGFIKDSRTHIVEFSSPNIAKPFTIGHLRSTIIGDAIARILSHAGYKVVRDNHLGDWGTQFGKMITAILKWGDMEKIANAKEPVKELVALYQRLDKESEIEKEGGSTSPLLEESRQWFVKLEKGNAEARRLWQFCVDCSMKEFSAIYERLGVSFDTYLGESFFQDKMQAVIDDAKEKGIARMSEGSLVIFFPNDKPDLLPIIKSDGGTLYAARDITTDRYRVATYGSDVIIINEVGKEQEAYFKQTACSHHARLVSSAGREDEHEEGSCRVARRCARRSS